MSSIVGSILRQLAEKRWHNVLTFPNNYIFDSYWAQADLNVWMWTYRTPSYNSSLFPSINILKDEILPIDVDFDLIIVHNHYTYIIGKQLSNNYHIPLVYWRHDNNPVPPASWYLRSTDKIPRDDFPVIGYATKQVKKTEQKKFLTRMENFQTAASLIPANQLEPLNPDFETRHAQYAYAGGLINLTQGYVPEIEECKANDVNVFSIPNVLHTEINIFEDDVGFRTLVEAPLKRKVTQINTIENFTDQIVFMCESTKEYIHGPI